MQTIVVCGLTVAGLVLGAVPVGAQFRSCRPDQVKAGTVCIDLYEASVWEVPDPATTNKRLVRKLQKGKVTVAELSAAGATQKGVGADDYGAGCPDTADGCTALFAASVAGVTPSRFTTWFQASAACRNSLKKLPSNLEWQVAAFGTPDPGATPGASDCNTNAAGPVATGQRTSCVSDVGAFDMVGNVTEWVSDWGDLAAAFPSCTNWTATFGSDLSCTGGDTSPSLPGAVRRGGHFGGLDNAGVFDVLLNEAPDFSSPNVGFRCARPSF